MRSSVLRGGAATKARPARIDSDLHRTAFAAGHVVDARLTDPHLEAVVAQAAADAAEQGRAEGHLEGYAAGLAAAAAEAAAAESARAEEAAAAQATRDAQLAAALNVLADTTAVLCRLEAVAVADVEGTVVELALEIARAVLDRELRTAVDPGAEALGRALALAPDGAPATARLHPRDLDVLQDVDALRGAHQLRVVADPSVEPGGCVVESAGRRIDAQVGAALERVAAVLR